ncbi:hypothetical protein [Rhodovulum steppense]|uniref:Uncharacterized protein n=1 Tax=Rhodovulum steppense TaxID=540251 RepID=A0A4R1YMK0_9RHOB|nr:hypothetical protein [Rhodovulum steppense]TCM78996.1 hypothetical protein EV216_12443 [Rhodovulum steppense]
MQGTPATAILEELYRQAKETIKETQDPKLRIAINGLIIAFEEEMRSIDTR